jgi:hypothetical protein
MAAYSSSIVYDKNMTADNVQIVNHWIRINFKFIWSQMKLRLVVTGDGHEGREPSFQAVCGLLA